MTLGENTKALLPNSIATSEWRQAVCRLENTQQRVRKLTRNLSNEQADASIRTAAATGGTSFSLSTRGGRHIGELT